MAGQGLKSPPVGLYHRRPDRYFPNASSLLLSSRLWDPTADGPNVLPLFNLSAAKKSWMIHPNLAGEERLSASVSELGRSALTFPGEDLTEPAFTAAGVVRQMGPSHTHTHQPTCMPRLSESAPLVSDLLRCLGCVHVSSCSSPLKLKFS